ncbi:MAG: hypothetical protein ACREL1_01065 [bacterium]
MKTIGLLGLLAVCSFALVSCSGSKTPTPTLPTGSTSITLYTPELESGIAVQDGSTNAVQLLIDTDTKLVDYAAVTLSSAGLSMPLTYGDNISDGGYYSAYYYSTGWNCVSNQAYTLTVSYDSHTYQASIKSVGNVQFDPGASALTITWQGGGNENTVSALQTVTPNNSYTYGPNLTAPYVIQQSNLGSYSSGTYDITASLDELTASNFSGGAYIGSFFNATDQETYTY